MRRTSDRVVVLLCVAAVALILAPQTPQTAQTTPTSQTTETQTETRKTPQRPVFRSGVDIVVVEATVVDNSGGVVKGLAPSDFAVEIGGRSREVVSAELVEYEAAAAATVAPIDPDITTNVMTAGAARTIVIVVDQASLRSESRGVLKAAQQWLSSLGPSDRVGLVTMPSGGPRVEFTTEHARVAEALGKVVPVPSASTLAVSLKNVGLWEGLRIHDGDMFVRSQVVSRECRAGDVTCPQEVDMAARDIAMDAQYRVQTVLANLQGLVRGMSVLPGPKHMVLISSGWPIDERSAATELSSIAAAAALSNVTVHTFTAEQWALSAAVSRPSPTMTQDQNVLLDSVEMLSSYTGGQAARLVGNGENAFKTLTEGLAGYYRVGVRVASDDLDGKTHRISMKLTRPGATLRGYRRVMAATRPGTTSRPADVATSLRDALKSPEPRRDLELRATSYVMHGESGSTSTLRVVVVGDVARAAAGPATALTAIYDLEGKAVTGGELTLDVPEGARGRLQNALIVKPGQYRLRVAVRDADGQIGTLERGIDARWVKSGAVETTGLVLFSSGRASGSAPEPLLDVVAAGSQVIAQLALKGMAPNTTPEVTIDVTRDGTTSPLMTRSARVARTAAGATLAQEIVPVELLPPGRYRMSATVLPKGATRFTRSFVVAAAPADSSTAAPATGGGGETAAPSPEAGALAKPAPAAGAAPSLVRPPRFSAASMLDPAFVTPVIDRLAGRADAAGVRDALAEMKSGPWPTNSAQGPLAAAPLAASFVAGLGKLHAGDLEGAANDFRAALRAAPDFTPAMMYLGACYAAGSKDREAAAAWQTALLRDRDSPALARLAIDAWLRAERPTSAIALIKQARARWPADESFVQRQARAELAEGRKREALDIVVGLEAPDEPLLLLSLATLYEAARAGSPVWTAERDLQVMRDLRERYAKLEGPSLALVDAWLEAFKGQ